MSDFGHALAIFGLTFVLEDIAVIGAALLVVNSMVAVTWAAGASFAGIWLGDIGLYVLAYVLGRPVLDRKWFQRFMGKVDLRKSERWFRDHGTLAILISRAIPGTRLPTYLAAGLLKVPSIQFATVTCAACAVWVSGLFWFSYHTGMMILPAFEMLKSELAKLMGCIAVAVALGIAARKALHSASLSKYRRWEFWPMWLFYIPVGLKYAALAWKYRSLTLPALANPGMELGGLIGESKYDTLQHLEGDFTAKTKLLPFDEHQIATVRAALQSGEFTLPFILKPDVGQRGDGFKLIHTIEQAEAYFAQLRRAVVMQEYVPGPHEAGIFYYRYPDQQRGDIFAITGKTFPEVVGDGASTIKDLIDHDQRAHLIAHVYLKRFGQDATRVPAVGECVRLVEAGNHCQGAIFTDAAHLESPELVRRIEEISARVPGFFIGRYDVRYTSDEDLRRGTGFKILELNGASSEATSIYDARNTLRDAYRVLFRQWEILFAIGAQNRTRALTPPSWRTIICECRRYREMVASLPVTD